MESLGKPTSNVIPEDIIKRAADCHRNLACLRPENKGGLCLVTQSINGVLFVDYKHSRSCNWMVPFGFDFICTCPLRKEMYTRYRV
jgi:hypothetical protein